MANREEGRWRDRERGRSDRDWYGGGREGGDWEGGWSGERYGRGQWYGEPEYQRYSTRGEFYGPGDFYRRGQEGSYRGFSEEYPRGYRGEGLGSWYDRSMAGYGYGRLAGDRTIGERGYAGRGPKGYRRSDERIQEDVNDRMTWNAELDASDIEVRVVDGEVTLTGVVEDRSAKRLAEDLAEDVFGVRDVHNQLKVRHGFLAGLTGEKADERQVPVTSTSERSETTRREGRAAAGRSAGRT
jgi:osmotically-inducible protein OsmY